MGGIIIKPRIILLTKKNLFIYAAILLVLIFGMILLIAFNSSKADVTSSGYTYLKYKDGTYIGTEKTENGNIQVEVTITDEKIKDIILSEMPAKYIKDNPTLKDDIPQMIFDIVKNQDTVPTDAGKSSAYVLNKVEKAVRTALDQSLILQ